MRNWEKALSVLEALRERGQAAGHGWTLDTELLPPHQGASTRSKTRD